MNGLFLLDVAPDPVSSAGVLIVLTIIVLAMVAVLIGGFVFLLVWRKRRKANLALVATGGDAQSSIPNQ
jgi:hypothetical protein